jgi:hypothetical protein
MRTVALGEIADHFEQTACAEIVIVFAAACGAPKTSPVAVQLPPAPALNGSEAMTPKKPL